MRFPRFSPRKTDDGSQTRMSEQEKPLQQELDEALVLARAIHGAGMAGVATFVLHMLKPLHWMGGQALWVLQPFIEGLGVGPRRGAGLGALSSGGVARLLEREGGLDELVLHLEQLETNHECARDERGNGNGEI